MDCGVFDGAPLPSARLVQVPEHLLQAVGDGEAAVLRALEHDPLGPEVHGQAGPIVVATDELVPSLAAFVLPGSVLGYEAPQGREVEDDPVVEVGPP